MSQAEAISIFESQSSVSFNPGMTLRDIERQVIIETLKQQRFNRTRTAKVLEIGIRTLQRKLKQYQLEDLGGRDLRCVFN